MRRLLLVPLVFLITTAAYGQSAPPPISLESGANACKFSDVRYAGSKWANVDSSDTATVELNIGMCEDWAMKHGNLKELHNSFLALESLHNVQSAALKEELNPREAPPVCKVFVEYQTAIVNAISAAAAIRLPDSEVRASVSRAEKDFLAGFSDSFERSAQAVTDLSTCSRWASDQGLTVVALKVDRLADEFQEDPGKIPASIESEVPDCKNAESEADTILDFATHADNSTIMPSEVEPYYHRATPLVDCAERLAQTGYREAEARLLLAVAGIDNLTVIADNNSDAKLIHALSSQRPSTPVVIKIQNNNSYQPSQNTIQQTSAPTHCFGTVTDFGEMSSLDWNCN